MTQENRNVGLDLLRGLSMLYVVGFWHMLNYTRPIDGLYTSFGTWSAIKVVLGTFVFLSAYFAAKSIKTLSRQSVGQFYVKRVLRIYPLYLVAVLLFFLLKLEPGGTSLKSAFLVAILVGPAPKTLWFICMLVLFYALVPACVLAIDRLRGLLWLAICVVFYGALTAYSYGTGWLDTRILLFLPAFLAGVTVARKDWSLLHGLKSLWLLGLLALSVFFALVTTLGDQRGVTADIVALDVPMVTIGACLLFSVAGGLRVKQRAIVRCISLLSYSTYCMYLFHRPIYKVMTGLWMPGSTAWQLVYLVCICLPIIIVASYVVQRGYDAALGLVGTRRRPTV
jgi:peptidoglycan/LPS O-acetylase OafA/YrhL